VAKLLSLGADAALVDSVRACSYMNTCMYISLYVFIRMKGSCSNLYPSLHLHAHTRKVAFMHAYMKTCTYTDLMSKRELRHEYPHPSEVFLCGYSRSMYLNVIQITLYLDDIRLIHTHTQAHTHTRKCNQVYRIYDRHIHARTHVHTYTHM
jgi:hypothetical protein